MSTSASTASPDITCITPEPFVPKPLIEDILRTRYCVPDSIFLVEGVDVFYTSKSKRWRAIRLMLGDGELCIQALMAPETHRFVDRGQVVFGVYIKLEKFRVDWQDMKESGEPTSSEKESDVDNSAKTGAGQSDDEEEKGKEKKKTGRQMVYLIVDSLEVVGWHNTLIDSPIDDEEEAALEAIAAESDKLDEESQETQETQETQPNSPEPETEIETGTAQQHPQTIVSAQPKPEGDGRAIDKGDEDFEVNAVSANKATENREVVVTSATNNQPENPRPPRPTHAFTQPLKLTKLRSIPNLPYKQNWSVNVLCIVSAISDVEPAGIPPYTQRQARLTDPSTDKHVLLTVFLDAHLFMPKVGSVVLLCGVKNHRFDGGSLKKYDSDRPKNGGSWWFEEPVELPWCDVEGLRQWWAGWGEE